MMLGKVIGDLWATIQHPFYQGKKLMIVEKMKFDGQSAGGYVIAVDTVGAGPGEQVLIVDEGNGARQILNSKDGPVRTVIVGIVDHIDTAAS